MGSSSGEREATTTVGQGNMFQTVKMFRWEFKFFPCVFMAPLVSVVFKDKQSQLSKMSQKMLFQAPVNFFISFHDFLKPNNQLHNNYVAKKMVICL